MSERVREEESEQASKHVLLYEAVSVCVYIRMCQREFVFAFQYTCVCVFMYVTRRGKERTKGHV